MSVINAALPSCRLVFCVFLFCLAVHPKTGRVCVPIDPANVREFDPFVVPTLGQLARQIDQYDKEHGEEVSVGGFQTHAFGTRVSRGKRAVFHAARALPGNKIARSV